MKKNLFYSLLFLACIPLLHFSCRKKDLEADPEKSNLKIRSGSAELFIDVEDIYAAMPQVIMHNLDSLSKFYVGRSQWKQTPEGILVRIPTSTGNNGYIYASKTYADPTKTNVYAVNYVPERTSSDSNFTGKEIWIDFQSWKSYGIQYNNNSATAYMQPQILAQPDWELLTTMHGHYYTNASGLIALQSHGGNTSSVFPQTNMRPTIDPYKCPGEESWLGGLFKDLGDFFTGIGNWIGGIFGGGGGGTPGSGTPGGGGGSWGPGGGYSGPGGSVGGGWLGGGAAEPGGPNPGPVEYRVRINGSSPDRSTVFSPDRPVQYVVSVLGLHGAEFTWLSNHLDQTEKLKQFWLLYYPDLTADQKKELAKEHLKMMMENADYLNQINNLTGNWWDRDQEELIAARKIQLQLYLQASPYGLIDCDVLNQLPMTMYQDVGSYQVPQSVINRIDDIRSQNAPAYTLSNFKIQAIQDAVGGIIGNVRVNCDYFTVKINTLPYENNVQLTADQFLEYFRTHINDFISSNVSVHFEPYIDFVSGSVNVNETTLFNSNNELSLGALLHIDMDDDGTIVESGYSRNFTTNHHNFTVTTMKTPLDYSHPVAGNRRWGIFPSSGGYTFYIMGVDRTNDYSTSFVNLGNVAFDGADELWHSVQDGVQSFVNNHQGSSPSKDEVIARPRWDAAKDFLLGKKSMAEYKATLHCP